MYILQHTEMKTFYCLDQRHQLIHCTPSRMASTVTFEPDFSVRSTVQYMGDQSVQLVVTIPVFGHCTALLTLGFIISLGNSFR